MDAYEALVTRRSPSAFAAGDLDPSVAGKLLAAAINAPDHGRLRPWRFIVMQGADRARFGDVLADALRKRIPGASVEIVEKERAKPMRAPLIITVIARVTDNSKIPGVEQLLAVGAAAQNIMIAAHAMGLAATWKSGDPAYDINIKQTLGLLEGDHVVGFMYIGRPKEFPPKPADEGTNAFLLPF